MYQNIDTDTTRIYRKKRKFNKRWTLDNYRRYIPVYRETISKVFKRYSKIKVIKIERTRKEGHRAGKDRKKGNMMRQEKQGKDMEGGAKTGHANIPYSYRKRKRR